jgi:biopolymer transport protein ExbB
MTLFSLLLQADTLAQAAAGTSAPEEISLWQLLKEGGVLMIPLLLCSILLVYVFVERFMVLRRASRSDNTFMSRIRDHITTGNLNAARSLSKNTQGPVARIIEKGISRIGKPIDHIEKSMESAGKLEGMSLKRISLFFPRLLVLRLCSASWVPLQV